MKTRVRLTRVSLESVLKLILLAGHIMFLKRLIAFRQMSENCMKTEVVCFLPQMWTGFA